jgi:hypothetical protein
MPPGKGGYKTLGVYLDVFTQNTWVDKFKTAGTGKTTMGSLYHICHDFVSPEVLVVDGGPHFNCKEVERFCEKWRIKLHIVPKYSPWVNGLVEGTHKILLHILVRLCAPDVGEEVWNATKWEDLPQNWPDHLDEAVRIMNWRILPSVKYCPKELMLGRIVNVSAESASVDVEAPAAADFETHMAYVAQQRLNGYATRVKYALSRKAAFDRKVLASRTGVVTFKKGELVQVANSVWDYTFKTLRKLIY